MNGESRFWLIDFFYFFFFCKRSIGDGLAVSASCLGRVEGVDVGRGSGVWHAAWAKNACHDCFARFNRCHSPGHAEQDSDGCGCGYGDVDGATPSTAGIPQRSRCASAVCSVVVGGKRRTGRASAGEQTTARGHDGAEVKSRCSEPVICARRGLNGRIGPWSIQVGKLGLFGAVGAGQWRGAQSEGSGAG